MEVKKPTTTLFHDTRRAKGNGTYPVKITVYFDGDKRRYDTAISLTESDWERINAEKLRDDTLKTVKRTLNAKLEYAQGLIDKMEVFSFEAFADLYYQRTERKEKKEKAKKDNLEDAFNRYIAICDADERNGSSEMYVTTRNVLLNYKAGLKVSDITPQFLKDFESYKIKTKGNSPTTVGIYMRHLRAVINQAIEDKIITKEQYPFKSYEIPSARNIKKALSDEELKVLLTYKPDDAEQFLALDFWVFTYLCNGMNMKDICLLRWERMQDDLFFFYRAKTINTRKKDLRPVNVVVTARVKEILERRANQDKVGYVFPILQEVLTAKQIDGRVKTFIKRVNSGMKAVCAALGITADAKTMQARHSHASALKRKGASPILIQNNLGHSSFAVTENYLADFTDDVKKEYANLLSDV